MRDYANMTPHRLILLTLSYVFVTCSLSAGEISESQLRQKTTIQCGSLIYGGGQTSVCFADHFLTQVGKVTNLNAARMFTPVQLGSDSVFNTPFCVWSGEGAFSLTTKEREHLKKYLQ